MQIAFRSKTHPALEVNMISHEVGLVKAQVGQLPTFQMGEE